MNVLFVPAADIKPIDSLENTRTLARCQAALTEWQNGAYDFIIVSGGTCFDPSIETRPAAELMREWFLSQPNGPKPNQIVSENKSRDTYENIKLSFETIDPQEIEQMTVVTHRSHFNRIKLTAQAYRVKNFKFIDPQYDLSLTEKIKEALFWLIHWFDRKGDNIFSHHNRQRRTVK